MPSIFVVLLVLHTRLTDEDVECANKNECPYYIPNDDE